MLISLSFHTHDNLCNVLVQLGLYYKKRKKKIQQLTLIIVKKYQKFHPLKMATDLSAKLLQKSNKETESSENVVSDMCA